MKTFWKILSAILAAALCVAGFAGLTAWALARTAEALVTRETLMTIVEQVDTKAFIQDLVPANSPPMIAKAVDSEEVQVIIRDYLVGYVRYVVTGENEFNVTDEQKAALTEKVVKLLEEENGPAESEAARTLTVLQTRVTIEGVLTQYLPTYGELDIGLPEEATELIRNLLSPDMRILFMAVFIASALLIMLIRFSLYKWAAWTGYTALTSSILLILMKFVPVLFIRGDDMTARILTLAAQTAGSYTFTLGLWILAGAAISLIFFYTVNGIRRKKRAK